MNDSRVYNLIVTREVIGPLWSFPVGRKLLGSKSKLKINGKWVIKWTVWPKNNHDAWLYGVPRRNLKYDKHPTRKEVIPMPKKKGGKKGSCK